MTVVECFCTCLVQDPTLARPCGPVTLLHMAMYAHENDRGRGARAIRFLGGSYTTLSVGSCLACAIGARCRFKMPPIASQKKGNSNPNGVLLSPTRSHFPCAQRVRTRRVLMRARVGDCLSARAERSPTSCRPLIDASSSQATLGASPATKPRADALSCFAWRCMDASGRAAR